MKITLFFLIKIIPRKSFTFITKKIVDLKKPVFLVKLLKKYFVKIFRINMDEAEHNIDYYESVQHLFTRKLKNGVRIIDKGIVSPVDGFVSEAGQIKNNTLIQAKGLEYSLSELIPEKFAHKYADGWFCTIYLSPQDYHRIHSVCSGTIKSFYYQPGELYPVNTITVPYLKNLFTVNERLTTFLETESGDIAIVKVAALGVGNIPLTYFNNYDKMKHNNYKPGMNYIHPEIKINKNDEIGMFSFGSTVILLMNKDIPVPDFNLLKYKKIKVGQNITLV